jgi:hypothetical protein
MFAAALLLQCGAGVVAATVSDGVSIMVGDPLPSRPWRGVGYNVLNFDFEEAEQPAVAQAFRKRWADANASWARVVDPTGFWDFNVTRFAREFAPLFRDVTNTALYWTEFHPALPDPGNASALAAWAAGRVEFIGSLVVDGGATNLRYYCFSNEEENVPKSNTTNWIMYVRVSNRPPSERASRGKWFFDAYFDFPAACLPPCGGCGRRRRQPLRLITCALAENGSARLRVAASWGRWVDVCARACVCVFV